MNAQLNSQLAPSATLQTPVARIIAVAVAGLLGMFIVLVAGLSHLDAVHNAAHDYRHSMGFPCH